MSRVTFEYLIGNTKSLTFDHELIESFYLACQVKNLTKTTLRCYAERLSYLVNDATLDGKGVGDLTYQDVRRYIMSAINEVSAATVNGRIAVYEVFYNHLCEEGLLDEHPTSKLKKIRAPRTIKPVLKPEQIGSILAKLNRKTFHGSRDYCMILLTSDGMLRLNELLSIKLEDIPMSRVWQHCGSLLFIVQFLQLS